MAKKNPGKENLEKSLKGRPIPAALEQLAEFASSLDHFFATGFEFSDCSDQALALSGSKDEELASKVVEFANADGSGSRYAFWVDDSGDLELSPILVFGSEGGVHVVAKNIYRLLELLTLDAEPMVDWDEVSYHKSNDEEHSPHHAKYLKWAKEKFKIKKIDDAEEVLLEVRDLERKFQGWFEKYYGTEKSENDFASKALASLSVEDGALKGSVYFKWFGEHCDLAFEDAEAGRIRNEAGITPEHKAALEGFFSWGEDLRARLATAAYEYAIDFEDAVGDWHPPKGFTARNALRGCKPTTVGLISYQPGQRLVRVGFDQFLPDLHGMEWVIRNESEILYVGEFSMMSVAYYEKHPDTNYSVVSAARNARREKVRTIEGARAKAEHVGIVGAAKRLFEELEKSDDAFTRHLRPGLSGGEIKNLVEPSGMVLPADAILFYRAFNLPQDYQCRREQPTFFGAYWLLGLDDAVKQYALMKSIEEVKWDSRWIPFLQEDGNFYVLEASKKSMTAKCPVLYKGEYDIEPSLAFVGVEAMFDTFYYWISEGVLKIESGHVQGEYEGDPERVAEIARRFNPGVKRWERR